MATAEKPTASRLYGDGPSITVEFRSKYPEFDWDKYPKGELIHLMDDRKEGQSTSKSTSRSYYFIPTGSAEVFLLTGEGFWYSNKRFPRAYPSLVRDWPSEDPPFDLDVPVRPYYFIGRDINVETETIMFQGRPFKPNCQLRDRDRPYILTPDGYIKQVMWYDVPEIANLAKSQYKFVQMFKNKIGEERMVETGLAKDGRTFVLVNEEIEAEMDDDKWWAENQNVIPLERRDGMILPCHVHREQGQEEGINDGSDDSLTEEYIRAIIEATTQKDDPAKIDKGVVISRKGSRNKNASPKIEKKGVVKIDERVSMSREGGKDPAAAGCLSD